MITRAFDGQETRVSLTSAEQTTHGPEAEGQLLHLLRKSAATATSPMSSLAAVLTRSVYLQQDLVRQLIDSVTDQERFSAVSELVGAGRVTDFQVDLEKAKMAWTKATNARATEVQGPRNRLLSMELRLAELRGRTAVRGEIRNEVAWNEWWRRIGAFGVDTTLPDATSNESGAVIDSALRQLDGLRRATQRRLELGRSVQNDLITLGSMPTPDVSALRSQLETNLSAITSTRQEVAREQERAAQYR